MSVTTTDGARTHRVMDLKTSAPEELQALEDHELVALTRAGDDLALLALIERYRQFARSLARPYFITGGANDDLVQEAMIGLFKSIRDFDLDQEAPYRAFAKLCIQRQIATAIKGANRLKHRPLNKAVSLEAPIRSGDGDTQVGDALPAVLPEPEDLVISAEEVEALRDLLLNDLTQLEADALALYIQGCSYSEIAAILGNHSKAIDNSLQRIRAKVRKHLEERAAEVLS